MRCGGRLDGGKRARMKVLSSGEKSLKSRVKNRDVRQHDSIFFYVYDNQCRERLFMYTDSMVDGIDLSGK